MEFDKLLRNDFSSVSTPFLAKVVHQRLCLTQRKLFITSGELIRNLRLCIFAKNSYSYLVLMVHGRVAANANESFRRANICQFILTPI